MHNTTKFMISLQEDAAKRVIASNLIPSRCLYQTRKILTVKLAEEICDSFQNRTFQLCLKML